MNEQEHRAVVRAVIAEQYCCKRVPPNHPNNHNRQVRDQGRCWCECHGQRVR